MAVALPRGDAGRRSPVNQVLLAIRLDYEDRIGVVKSFREGFIFRDSDRADRAEEMRSRGSDSAPCVCPSACGARRGIDPHPLPAGEATGPSPSPSAGSGPWWSALEGPR